MPHDARPWVAAINADGRGLFQTSTSRLRGRKLFRWGIQPGGQNWQKFLGTPDYIEIQAGLARTQSHHLPIPPKTTWSWIEAYGEVQADPTAVHGSDWRQARQAVGQAIDDLIADEVLEAALRDSAEWADLPTTDLILNGSGWGALETARRAIDKEPSLDLSGVFYPAASLDAEHEPWRLLLKTGAMPEIDPLDEPGSFATHAEWVDRLEASLTLPGGRHWASLFHLGVVYWQAGQTDQANHAWRASCEATENPWARRCLGAAEMSERRFAQAIPHLRQALEMLPDLRPLVVEYLSALLADQQFGAALKAIDALAPQLRHDGRVRLLEGQSLLAVGDDADLERLLDEAPIADDMREGESGLSDLWFELQARRAAQAENRQVTDADRALVRRTCSLPTNLDYRMGS